MASPFNQPAGAREFGAALEDDGLDADYSMIADYAEVDYYALLGLSQNPPPTDTEIRSAYRTLTLSFHPDKQPPHLREAAEHHFNRIQEAYNTLIDPNKRTVYDIRGAEGVKQEWGPLGAMGRGGEAQRQEVGVKAMSPDQFRRWFLKTMKERERKAVESLVSSRGAITLGVDASTAISVNEEDSDVTFHIPSPKLATYALAYNFKAPLFTPPFWSERADEDVQKEDADAETEQRDENPEPVEVTFNASIAGKLVQPKQAVTVEYEDGTEGEESILLPKMLASQNITVGATVTPNMASLVGTKGLWSKSPFSLLKDSSVTVETLLLPTPTLKTNIVRAFQPVPGIKPFQVNASSIITRSLWETLPSFEVQVSKQIAERKIAVCTWSSGVLGWPGTLLERFSSLGMGIQTAATSASETSSLQIGLISVPKVPANAIELDEEDEDEGLRYMLEKQRRIDQAAESWQTHLQLSPAGGGLVLTYSRNLFSGTPADDPVKTEWSSEGYFPLPKMEQARAVRLEVSSIIGLNMSLSWSVKGVRRIGEHTRLGLGVGIAENGLIMTVSWSRLGQSINLPVTVCPAGEANHDAAVLATIFPWLAYCAVEFGYIRPRNRKKRRQAAARRHRELKKLIPQKREESQQAIELMTDQVQRRQAREEAQDGLVVTKAEYGYVPPTTKKPKPGFTDSRLIDVTIAVAARVDRGQLVIPQDTLKFQIMGFHDPAPLLPKRLRIWYRFQGREHFVEAGDKEGIACPMRTHLISP